MLFSVILRSLRTMLVLVFRVMIIITTFFCHGQWFVFRAEDVFNLRRICRNAQLVEFGTDPDDVSQASKHWNQGLNIINEARARIDRKFAVDR